MWRLEDVHLLTRAFQIQHFTLPRDTPAFDFLQKADKKSGFLSVCWGERYLALLNCLQKCPGPMVLCSGPGIAF